MCASPRRQYVWTRRGAGGRSGSALSGHGVARIPVSACHAVGATAAFLWFLLSCRWAVTHLAICQCNAQATHTKRIVGYVDNGNQPFLENSPAVVVPLTAHSLNLTPTHTQIQQGYQPLTLAWRCFTPRSSSAEKNLKHNP